MRGKRGNVRITNEHMTSQTCVFCYGQLEHPVLVTEENGKLKKRYTKGSLLCINPNCVSVKYGRATKCRDALSSLAIGISGLAFVTLGVAVPRFSPTKISQYDTEEFNNKASAFCKEEKKSKLRSN